MANENVDRRRTQPIRIIHMSIASGDPRPSVDAPLVIVAKLDPVPDREELQWWREQLGERVKVRAWSGPFNVCRGHPGANYRHDHCHG